MKRKWNAEEALQKWVKANLFSSEPKNKLTNNPTIHLYKKGDTIPIVELESVMVKAAKIVDQLGEEYMDIFERAERELEGAKAKISTLEKIQLIAKEKPALDLECNLIKPHSFLLQSWAKAIART